MTAISLSGIDGRFLSTLFVRCSRGFGVVRQIVVWFTGFTQMIFCQSFAPSTSDLPLGLWWLIKHELI